MNKKKITLTLCAVLLCVLVFVGWNVFLRDAGHFYVDEVAASPHDFTRGRLTLTGTVGSVLTTDFTLVNEAGDFFVMIFYRGNQALPRVGDRVVVEGRFRENRPCCGPGFSMTVTAYEPV